MFSDFPMNNFIVFNSRRTMMFAGFGKIDATWSTLVVYSNFFILLVQWATSKSFGSFRFVSLRFSSLVDYLCAEIQRYPTNSMSWSRCASETLTISWTFVNSAAPLFAIVAVSLPTSRTTFRPASSRVRCSRVWSRTFVHLWNFR